MALATLSIDLEARLAKFEENMDKAGRIAEKNAAETEAAWKRAGSVLANFAAGLGIGAAVAGLEVLREKFRDNVEQLDKLNDVADATGASIENISALEDLARRTGTTLDVATTAMVKLNGALNEAKPDSLVAQAFKAIGVEADKLKGLDPAEALRQLAVGLSGFADDGNKARVVQELFGKSLREVAPLLNDLAEKTSLVATTTAEQAKEAEKFNKQLFELQANSALSARHLANELLPALNQLFDAIKGKDVGGDSVLNQLVVVPLQTITVLGANVAYVFKGIGAEVGGIAAQLAALARLDFKGFKVIGQEMSADAQRARDDLDKLEQRLLKIGTVRSAPVAGSQAEAEAMARRLDKATYEKASLEVPAVAKADKAKAEQLTEAQRALAAYVKELERELDKTTELTEREKALNLLKSLGTLGQVDQVRELVLGMERQITLAKQDAAIRADNLRITKEQEAAEKSLNDELYRLSGRAGEDRKIALTTKLEEQLAGGTQYSTEELNRIVNGIAGIADKGKDAIDELDELTKQFGRNTQNLLGDTLERTLTGHFDGIGKAWGDLLIKMTAQAAALQLGKSLFGDFFKTGELGGSIGDLVGQVKSGGGFGDVLGSIAKYIPFFATGGDHAGGLRIVGENGPELEATGPARIFNAAQTRSILRGGSGGGAQLTYAPVYQIDSRSDRGQVLADIEAANRRHQGELLKFFKAKGVL